MTRYARRNPKTRRTKIGFKERYELGKEIGFGAFGKVFLAKDRKTNETVAIKFFRKNVARELPAKEIRNLRFIAPNCKEFVCLVDSGESEGKPFIVMNFVDGINGSTFFENLPDTDEGCQIAKKIFQEAKKALKRLNDMGIEHRDSGIGNTIIRASPSLGVFYIDFGVSDINVPKNERNEALKRDVSKLVGSLDWRFEGFKNKCAKDFLDNTLKPITAEKRQRSGNRIGFEVLKRSRRNRIKPEEKYELMESLGSGASGEVFAAIEKKTGKKVAIKLFTSINAAGRRELAQIEINNLNKIKAGCKDFVCIIDSGEFEGQPFIVMGFVSGQTLQDFITNNLTDTQQGCDLLSSLYSRVVNEVNKLHKLGLAHNDLNPNNIMVESNGKPRLIDFGLSCFLGSCPVSRALSGLSELEVFNKAKQGDKFTTAARFNGIIKSRSGPRSFRKPKLTKPCFKGIQRRFQNDMNKYAGFLER